MASDAERLLILGAGYVGAKVAELALERGHTVVLADNWYATERAQLASLERRGARVVTADIRHQADVERLLDERPRRVFLLAAQASRPLADRDPDYTEETNLIGTRRVAASLADAGGPAVVYASSLHVHGRQPPAVVDENTPYGPQDDLAHLSKVYGEGCLGLYARRGGFDVAILRLGIVYGPSPVEHERPESQTVVDKFRRLAANGATLPIDDGRATIGVVHVADVARIMLDEPRRRGVVAAPVAAETVTVAGVAALASGGTHNGQPAYRVKSPFRYDYTLGKYLSR